uniref:Transient receptor potential-gamma protein-like n=1 Tax=Saccoglossus kowalevskii TaxID=10224 RepID=A0ABM0MPG0_SACKO|nr:PREDICTED: transient receptor potential-gamma protein-like [Saccoglossus kowalevskii]
MLNDLCNFTNDPKSVLNLSRSDGKTALHLASAYGTVLFVRKILSLGAMVDERCMAGRTPIHDAILSDNEDKEDIAAVLLEAGAGTNITDKDKMAAIHHATNIGNENIIKKLLQKGANVMTVNSIGQTPLHLAVNHGPPVLESLFSGGPGRDIPDVNARSSDGVTPLHLAAVVGNIEIMELLLKKGADPTIAAGKWKESALEMLYHNCLIKLKQDEMACNIRIAQQLSDDALIVATPRPINTSLHFATVFRSIAVASPDLSDGYERLSNQMDCLAVKLMQHCLNRNHALSLVEEDGNYLLNYALKYKHKKFISVPVVQRLLHGIWHGSILNYVTYPEISQSWPYFVLFFFTPILYPIALILYSITWLLGVCCSCHSNGGDLNGGGGGCCRCSCFGNKLYKAFREALDSYFQFVSEIALNCPAVKFQGNLMSYSVFLMLLFIKSQYLLISTTYIAYIDALLLAFLIGQLLEEVQQYRNEKSFWLYVNKSGNVFDFINIIGQLTLNIVGNVVSYHSYDVIRIYGPGIEVGMALITIVACIRLLYFVEVSNLLGQMQITFVSMAKDFFLVFAFQASALVAFGLVLTKVYSLAVISSHSIITNITVENAVLNATSTALSENATADLTEVDKYLLYVQNSTNSLSVYTVSLFWGLFGLSKIEDFDVDSRAIEYIGKILLGAYNLFAVIVLLNTLIAKMSDTYNRIEVSHWCCQCSKRHLWPCCAKNYYSFLQAGRLSFS